jgi:hypothetical protein
MSCQLSALDYISIRTLKSTLTAALGLRFVWPAGVGFIRERTCLNLSLFGFLARGPSHVYHFSSFSSLALSHS